MRSTHQPHLGYCPAKKNTTRRTLPLAPARVMLVLLLIQMTGTALSAEITTIILRENIELAGPNVLLEHVAEEISPANGKLAAIDLGPVPWPGSRRLIDPTVIKIALYREGINLNRIRIEGDGCIVTTQTTRITGEEIAAAARRLLVERLPWAEENIGIELEQMPEERLMAAGAGAPVLSASIIGEDVPRGKVNVIVTGIHNGTPIFKTTVTFTVNVFENVVVASRDIERGETFSEDSLSTRRMEVTALAPNSIFNQPAQLAGMKAGRVFRAGMPITRQGVIVPPVIRRGAVVNIIFETNSIKLTSRGIAREDGAPGDVIKVQNVDSGREVSGEVRPDGSISVSF